jgi:predicted small metal-binding protein
MSMRVIECNTCGEPLSAANDEELVRRLSSHMESEHPSVAFDESTARSEIAEQAYTASDN